VSLFQSTSPASQIAALRARRVQAARQAFGSFIEYCMVDEATSVPLVLAAHHRAWVDILRKHRKALVLAFLEAGKSQIFDVALPLFTLGRDPAARVAVVRADESQAREVVRLLAKHIETNERLHEVFPALRRGDGPWNETSLTVQRDVFAKDASVHAYGVGTSIVGARLSTLIVDDVVTHATSLTEAPRKALADKYFREIASRVIDGGTAYHVGTPYSRTDLWATLEGLGMPTFRFPITGRDGKSVWPERWPDSRIKQRRSELPLAEAARSLDLVLVDPATCVFSETMLSNALKRGERSTPLTKARGGWALLNRGVGTRLCMGVDLAISQRASADESAIAVVLQHPDRSLELLSLAAGRWGANEIIDRILDTWLCFVPDNIVIESVGMQAFVAGIVKRPDMSVIPYPTNAGALSLGNRVNDTEVQLSQNMWIIPSLGGAARDREVETLLTHMKYFSRQDHVPDRLTATMLGAWGCTSAGSRTAKRMNLDLMRR
jgi:hypothetical protein